MKRIGLSRAGFFKKAAFYGGTALRIFYGLDRFSEDLDFSLEIPDKDFDLKSFAIVLTILITIRQELLIGIWGQRYRRHLKKNHRILYYNYLTAGTLNRHISEVDKRANSMLKTLLHSSRISS